MKILLVEDDPGIIHSLTEFLTGEGFSITSVPGQQEAVNAYRSARFDLALIDISLENGDGYAVCRAIKADRDIPVIFLTASGDEASVVTGLDLGADDYIAKPFRPRELVSRHPECQTALWRSGPSDCNRRSSLRYRPGDCQPKRRGDPSLRSGVPDSSGVPVKSRYSSLPHPASRRDLGYCRRLCQRQYTHGLYQAHPGEDRARSCEAGHYPDGSRSWLPYELIPQHIDNASELRHDFVFTLFERIFL